MRTNSYAALLALVSTISTLQAGAFLNLDFERATVRPAPTSYTPWDAYQPISASYALPYWTVTENDTVCTAVWGAPEALDETSVALVHGYPEASLQGVYCVELSAVADATPPLFSTAAISQTGLVPAGIASIQFLIMSPPWGGTVQANPAVSMNGTPIPVFPISTVGGIMTMAGDVSAFAGTTANLTIQCAGTAGAPLNLMENLFVLDAIMFSTQKVPEPGTAELALVGSLIGFGLRSRQRKS